MVPNRPAQGPPRAFTCTPQRQSCFSEVSSCTPRSVSFSPIAGCSLPLSVAFDLALPLGSGLLLGVSNWASAGAEKDTNKSNPTTYLHIASLLEQHSVPV